MESLEVSAREKVNLDKYFSQVKVVTQDNISAIVEIHAESAISSIELTNNYVVLNGKLCVKVVYIADSGIVECADNVVEFIEKQKCNASLENVCGLDDVKIDTVTMSSGDVLCSVVHNTTLFGINKHNMLKFEESDSLVLNQKEYHCSKLVGSSSENFVVAEEVDTNLEEAQILTSSTNVMLTEASASVDKVIVEGKIFANILYNGENGVGELAKEFDFRQELAVAGTLPGMTIDAVLSHVHTTVTPENKDGKTSLVCAFDLFANTYVFDEVNVLSFDDLFSLKNEIVPTYDYIKTTRPDGNLLEDDTVLMLSDVSKFADFDDIIGVYMPVANVQSFEDAGERVTMTAKINAVVLYKTTETTAVQNVTYDVKFETAKEPNKKVAKVDASVSVSAFKVKAGKDLEVAFNICYKLDFENYTETQYIKSYEENGEKTVCLSPIQVYVAGTEQSVFDVARALNVKPELITSQNQIDGVIESGQKVYVYSPTI